MRGHPSSYTSVLLLGNYYMFMPIDSAVKHFLALSNNVRSSELGQRAHFDLISKVTDIKLKERLFNKEAFKQLSNAQSIYDFSLSAKDGKVVPLSTFKGKYVFLNIWASWCTPCIEHIPAINEIAKNLEDSNLEVISISIDQNKSSWLAAMKKHSLLGQNFIDQDGVVRNLFQINSFPEYMIIDKEGKLYKKGGMKPGTTELTQLLKSL